MQSEKEKEQERKLLVGPSANSEAMKRARGLLAMGALFGNAMGSIALPPKGKRAGPMSVEDSVRLTSGIKIAPEEAFVTAGPGPEPFRWYACLMRLPGPEELKSDPDAKPVLLSKMTEGFLDQNEALHAGAKQLPGVPIYKPRTIIGDDRPIWEWPYLNKSKDKILTKAEERRKKRAIRAHMNQIKSQAGQRKLTVGIDYADPLLDPVLFFGEERINERDK